MSSEEKKPELSPYDLFLMKHIKRVNMWIAQHKEHQKLPIIFDGKEFQWMNRKARRGK